MSECSGTVGEAGLDGWDLTIEFLRSTQRWREAVSRKLLLETDSWSFERAMPAREVANEAIGIVVGRATNVLCDGPVKEVSRVGSELRGRREKYLVRCILFC